MPHTDIETDRKRAIKKKIKKYLDGLEEKERDREKEKKEREAGKRKRKRERESEREIDG